MKQKQMNLSLIGRAVAWASACGFAAAVLMLTAGAASASYTGTIGINWGTDTTIAAPPFNLYSLSTIDGVFNTALKPLGVTTTITGAVADNTYTAENNVVGAVNTSGSVTSYTLSNLTGNTFLQNISEPVGNQQPTDSFTIAFSAPINLHSISFDYEIFPNINCTALGSDCGGSKNPNLPSLYVTDTYDTGVVKQGKQQTATALDFQRFGVVPGGHTVTGGDGYSGSGYNLNPGSVTNPETPLTTCSGVTPGQQKDCGGVGGTVIATTSTATYNGNPGPAQAGNITDHSGTSGAKVTKKTSRGTTTYTTSSTSDRETAPQLLGTSGNVSLTVGKGVTSLTFNDWPATIAISQISFKVPEPNSWWLVTSALVLLGLVGYGRAVGGARKRA